MIVVADRPPAVARPGDALALDVHVVSDLRVPLPTPTSRHGSSWAGGHHGWRWRGDVPADACVRVGTVPVVVPDAPGAMDLDLDLVGGDVAVTNRYRSTITRRDR